MNRAQALREQAQAMEKRATAMQEEAATIEALAQDLKASDFDSIIANTVLAISAQGEGFWNKPKSPQEWQYYSHVCEQLRSHRPGPIGAGIPVLLHTVRELYDVNSEHQAKVNAAQDEVSELRDQLDWLKEAIESYNGKGRPPGVRKQKQSKKENAASEPKQQATAGVPPPEALIPRAALVERLETAAEALARLPSDPLVPLFLVLVIGLLLSLLALLALAGRDGQAGAL